MLPEPQNEPAWVEAVIAAGPDAVEDAVEQALAARRPRLAAALIVHLPEDSDESDVIARARRAASLVLLRGGSAHDDQQEIELAWVLMRRRARSRVRERLRRSEHGDYRR
jgi:hypothetical protein